MIKTGRDHLNSIRDARTIFLEGRVVTDVTTHPAYRNAAATVGRLYDFQAEPANAELMTFPVAGKNLRANRAWQLPRSYSELVERRKAITAWSELHCGFMGRSPDHVASCIAAMAMGRELFEEHGKGRGKAIWDYYEYARDNDLYLAYVIIDPQGDRSKATGEQQDEFLTAAICDEDSEGITVKGAKMLGTSAIFANEVLVASLRPVREGDAKYAFTAAIPIGAKGLKLLSRKSYEGAAESRFDYPLASVFDENDAIVYFDEVKIPWERVFVHRNPAMSLAQFHATPAHSYQNYQAQIRLAVKLRYLVGLAHRICEAIGTIDFPQVREILGMLAAKSSMIEAAIHAMEVKGGSYGPYFVPDRGMLYGAGALAQQIYPEVIAAIRELAGGGVIMLPSSVRDFDNPELARLIGKTQLAANTDALGRVKLFKLAWDSVGSEFASRHTQYEMFYSGAKHFTIGNAFKAYDWKSATGLVDRLMGQYGLAPDGEQEVPR
ncbi:MAG TPA: 4-hydroxyphenylacetate 3-hydroxylase N-terminal domain-containing protein [Stellaceae bacterium]|nr:4-hydroxyphenylacetate 3-hydroxylase N-terminal domain-containing protein [Stellaceae bacterium]